MMGAIGSFVIAAGAIAYRHDLITVNINIKTLFFGGLLIVGAGMVLTGIRKNS